MAKQASHETWRLRFDTTLVFPQHHGFSFVAFFPLLLLVKRYDTKWKNSIFFPFGNILRTSVLTPTWSYRRKFSGLFDTIHRYPGGFIRHRGFCMTMRYCLEVMLDLFPASNKASACPRARVSFLPRHIAGFPVLHRWGSSRRASMQNRRPKPGSIHAAYLGRARFQRGLVLLGGMPYFSSGGKG